MMHEHELFQELIVAAGKLATVSDQAAEVLSEEFDDLVRPSVNEVREILARCPQPIDQWDGTVRDVDITEDLWDAPAPQDQPRQGVTLRHSITGIARQSYTKATVDENRAVARKALEGAVARRYESMQDSV
jgi:hypothetical protein